MELLINLISGAIGGNLAGGIMRRGNLGFFGNSLAGILGGSTVGFILDALGFNGLAIAGHSDGTLDGLAVLSHSLFAATCGAAVVFFFAMARRLLGR